MSRVIRKKNGNSRVLEKVPKLIQCQIVQNLIFDLFHPVEIHVGNIASF